MLQEFLLRLSGNKPDSIHEDTCSIPGLAPWVRDPVVVSCGVGCRLRLRSGIAVAMTYVGGRLQLPFDP